MDGRYPSRMIIVLSGGASSEHADRVGDPASRFGILEQQHSVTHTTDYLSVRQHQDPVGDDGKLTIYELSHPLEAPEWLSPGPDYPATLQTMSAKLDACFTAVFKRVGPEFRSGSCLGAPGGLLLVLTDRRSEVPPEVLDDWYSRVHVPEILSTGLYHTAYRYKAQTASDASRGEYLALYETKSDPRIAADALAELRSSWSLTPGYGNPTIVRTRSVYRRVQATER